MESNIMATYTTIRNNGSNIKNEIHAWLDTEEEKYKDLTGKIILKEEKFIH